VSPRQSPATAHELQRVGLLATLPGETLAKLAGRMQREEIAPGQAIVVEGGTDDRFYIVLSGVLAVTQETRGARRVLRPGDYFGEVAAAMGVPRTATVRALSTATVASCDRATFDDLVKPIFGA
jgi:CRP-like cAMP-binding protein